MASQSGSASTAKASADGAARAIRIDRDFILFPINNMSLPRRVRLVKDGVVLRSFSASLGLPADWWAHLDVGAWQGETLDLSMEPDEAPPNWQADASGRAAEETDDAALLAAVVTSDTIWSPETLYREPLRPLFHFSAMRGWNNDPVGLMHHDGRYHLFFQHNPYGVRWGNMHWGHAVSPDLVHWQELPIALYPRGDDDFPYSGSGVVDHGNTSGWAKDGRPPMVIAYTSTGRGECIAWSHDEGATWEEYHGNPVVTHEGRDPRLLWHAASGQWVMALYSERPGAAPEGPGRRGIAFHTSPDLKTWQERSWIDGYYECADLFALAIDGDPERVKWVLSNAPGYYTIGAFDGAQFVAESPRLPGHMGGGPNFKGMPPSPLPMSALYAGQSFSHHPTGERVEIVWAQVETAGEPFTQMMAFPTRLSLKTTVAGVRLCREPIDAIRSLRSDSHDFSGRLLTASPLLTGLEGEAWDIELTVRLGSISPVKLSIGGDDYIYRPAAQMLGGPNGAMSIPVSDGCLTLRLLVDRSSVEIFGDLGQAYGMFVRTRPGGNAALSLSTWEGVAEELRIDVLRVHALRSIWKD